MELHFIAVMTDDRRLRQQLIHAYETLAPLDQAILQLLSVIYDGVTKSPLLDCVRRCRSAALSNSRALRCRG